ncbi:cysteine-rich motor neuron 1 protein-like [Amphibalanus amphitrite]|uniref:cysteine-rich motor neuron 1 protein-like n=1 Tax=Amphibalanus amphitrite TaxID=1232801 RepID=UPI001C9208F3|nr:cysteine-rich motor neuron 1 protein-like [Amphibalanus amphitrite]
MASARLGLVSVALMVVLAVVASARRVQDRQFLPARPANTCLLSRITYNSGEMIERNNPCDFCFCYKGEVLCWKKQCPPPPPSEERCSPKYVEKECCPRYMCENINESINFI